MQQLKTSTGLVNKCALTLKQSKYHDKKENFEESCENVRFRICQQNEGEEGADAPVHDRGPDVGQSPLHSLLTTPMSLDKESEKN